MSTPSVIIMISRFLCYHLPRPKNVTQHVGWWILSLEIFEYDFRSWLILAIELFGPPLVFYNILFQFTTFRFMAYWLARYCLLIAKGRRSIAVQFFMKTLWSSRFFTRLKVFSPTAMLPVEIIWFSASVVYFAMHHTVWFIPTNDDKSILRQRQEVYEFFDLEICRKFRLGMGEWLKASILKSNFDSRKRSHLKVDKSSIELELFEVRKLDQYWFSSHFSTLGLFCYYDEAMPWWQLYLTGVI